MGGGRGRVSHREPEVEEAPDDVKGESKGAVAPPPVLALQRRAGQAQAAGRAGGRGEAATARGRGGGRRVRYDGSRDWRVADVRECGSRLWGCPSAQPRVVP